MVGISTSFKNNDKTHYVKENRLFRNLFTLGDFGPENGNNGQYFFGIWQLPQERTT